MKLLEFIRDNKAQVSAEWIVVFIAVLALVGFLMMAVQNSAKSWKTEATKKADDVVKELKNI